MSLLSPETLSVFIAPTELVAVRWRGTFGMRPQIVEKRIAQVDVKSGNSWEAAAQTFAGLLREFSSCRRVRVVLSSHFTQYQLLPWRDDLNDFDEELAVARLAFTQTYGEAAAHWDVRLSDEAPGLARVAAAVDADLLTALQQAAKASKARLDSIEPSLTATVNHWHSLFDRAHTAWLVVHEEGRICVALIEQGRWRWVRNLRTGVDWAESLPTLLDNELLLAGIDNLSAQALIFSPATPDLAVPANSPWSFRSLRLEASANFSPVTDGRFGFALVG